MSDEILQRLDRIEAAIAALAELIHASAPVAPQAPAEPDFWPDGKLPRVTGDLSLDFTDAMMGGRREPTPERDANLAEHDAAHAAAMFVGKWDADSLTDSDAMAIYAYTRTQPGTVLWNRVFWQAALFSGPRAAIARLISRGEAAFWQAGGVAEPIVAGWADCELKRDVTAVTV